MPIFLHNPHSVLAALERRPQDVFEIRMPGTGTSEAWERVRKEAERIGIPVGPPQERKKRPGRRSEGGRGASSEAVVKEREPASLFTLVPDAQPEGLYLALDGVQDPQNLGSIFRSAAFFGVRGMILPRDRAAPISQTVYDVACGGVEHVPFALETNLARALDTVKDRGLWILGSSEHADRNVEDVPRDRSWLLVIGNEESGLRRLTLEKCDDVCAIRAGGAVPSLNAAVAAGILMARLTL